MARRDRASEEEGRGLNRDVENLDAQVGNSVTLEVAIHDGVPAGDLAPQRGREWALSDEPELS